MGWGFWAVQAGAFVLFFARLGEQTSFLRRPGAGRIQPPDLYVEAAAPGCLLENKSEVRFLLCLYVWSSLGTVFWEFVG